MKGTRFEAFSSIQQTVMRELKAIWEEAFSRAFDSLYERCKCCAEAGGDGINKYFNLFYVVFYGLSSGIVTLCVRFRMQLLSNCSAQHTA
jgi:hypothetical protein